jgi:hypothetical protein
VADLDRAIAFVQERGDRLDRLRLQHARGEAVNRAKAEEVLASYPFADGSWAYNSAEERPSRIGSLGGTIHCLRGVREFGLNRGPQMSRTGAYLASIQSPDGSFYETEAKLAHSPQGWLQQDTLVDRFYFTGAVPMRLLSLGYGEHPVVQPAIKWLRGYWDDWRLVTGTWYNLWALLCLYPARIGLSDAQYQRGHAEALAWLPHLGAQPLTWLLDSLHAAGYPRDEPLVVQGMARLQALQDQDGAWPDPHAPVETTVTALRLLREVCQERYFFTSG